jgi:ubiquinone biosynthesis protein UbiJ
MLESWHGEVDARLTGSLSALGLMGLSATPMHAFFKGDVKIEGDTETAHKLQKLFAKLDLNLENRLAQITGVGFAHNLGQVFQQGRQWLRNSSHSLRLNIEEYLQEETRDLPAKPEAELLFGAIDLCRSDYDRLKARVERLETTLAEPQPQTGTPL